MSYWNRYWFLLNNNNNNYYNIIIVWIKVIKYNMTVLLMSVYSVSVLCEYSLMMEERGYIINKNGSKIYRCVYYCHCSGFVCQ